MPGMWSARLVAVVAASLLAAAPAAAPPASVEVRQPWLRWLPPAVADTALFGVILNHGDRAVRLVGGSTPAAERCVPMTTARQDSGSASGPMMTMARVPWLEIPPHGRLVLRPGGDHLMIMGLRGPLVEGETVSVTLRFDGADPVTLRVPVVRE
ncbi:MAG TPA: copper chaperone PCu(A)C [Trueperaceae bacterium]|nr:copper chaperone PCu(A)C [Trueperaceae bacterium]